MAFILQAILSTVSDINSLDRDHLVKWESGFASGCVYANNVKLEELCAQIYRRFMWTNQLHADLFPHLRRIEAEAIRMCLSLFNADDQACGAITSGGTESILLACLAYRELARSRGIVNPNMVISASAHPAFDKAGHYFNIKVVHVPVDSKTYVVNVDDMRAAIDHNTCMIVASAPSFPHGIIDPVEKIAKLGQSNDVPVHVDCCLGGFLLPFMGKAGYPIPTFDFRLPGVTSLSCDTHKYAFVPKGSSLILYRSRELRQKQFFVQPNWSGGIYASPTLAGSRVGSQTAVTWAVLLFHGEAGYIESTRRIIRTARFIADEIRQIPGLEVLGNPQVSVVAFTSRHFDILRLSELMTCRQSNQSVGMNGLWNLNLLQFPSAVHICVTDQHTGEGRAKRFVSDLAKAAAYLMAQPKEAPSEAAAIYGMSQTIPNRSIVSSLACSYLDAVYDTPIFRTKPTTTNGVNGHVKNK